MKHTTSFFFAVFAIASFLNRSVIAQVGAANAPVAGDTTAIASHPGKFHIGFRSEFGEATLPNFQFGFGFDVGIGKWVIQGDYRSYGGTARQSNTPATAYNLGIVGWSPVGNPSSAPIPDFPNTLDGINEYSLTVGKVYSCLHGALVLMPSIGLAAVSRDVVHYTNCEEITQPGTGWVLFGLGSAPQSMTWNQYTASVVPEVSITMPLSLHALIEFSSWIGLSISGWTEIGNGGTSGWSAGLEVGALP
jgi:hypothetical protein